MTRGGGQGTNVRTCMPYLYVLLCFGVPKGPTTPLCTKVPYILLCFGTKLDHPPPKVVLLYKNPWFCTKVRDFFQKNLRKKSKNSSKKIQKIWKVSEKKMEKFRRKNRQKLEKKVDFPPNLAHFLEIFAKKLYKSTIYTFVIWKNFRTPTPACTKVPFVLLCFGSLRDPPHPIHVLYFCVGPPPELILMHVNFR